MTDLNLNDDESLVALHDMFWFSAVDVANNHWAVNASRGGDVPDDDTWMDKTDFPLTEILQFDPPIEDGFMIMVGCIDDTHETERVFRVLISDNNEDIVGDLVFTDTNGMFVHKGV